MTVTPGNELTPELAPPVAGAVTLMTLLGAIVAFATGLVTAVG